MSKHTKAPWVVEESKWCGHDDCPYDHVKLTIVGGPAQLPIVSRDTYDHDLATARADARLIAASPDMLEALRLAKAFGSQGETDEGLSVSTFIENAIKKAEPPS